MANLDAPTANSTKLNAPLARIAVGKTTCTRLSDCIAYDAHAHSSRSSITARASVGTAKSEEKIAENSALLLQHGTIQKKPPVRDSHDHIVKEGTDMTATYRDESPFNPPRNTRPDLSWSRIFELEYPLPSGWAVDDQSNSIQDLTSLEDDMLRPTSNDLDIFHHQQEPFTDAFNFDTETPQTSSASQVGGLDISPGIAPFEVGISVTPDLADEPHGSKANRRRPASEEQRTFSLEDVTKQLTSRLGRLQISEDGLPRYYGATSNLHLVHAGQNSLVQPNIRNVLIDGEQAITQAGLQWSPDPIYEQHLIDLFFCWHNPLMYVLDQEVFLRERRRFMDGHETSLYSPALENAVFTLGTAYTDRSHPAVAKSTDEFFGFRTKCYLDIEIDSPTIATAQALLILSSHEAAHARESRGRINSAMAVQIMTDLGLHLNLENEYNLLAASDSIDVDTAVVRRNLFWSTNTIDTLWSAYSGRPCLMQHLAHNVQPALPSPSYHWNYYVDVYTSLRFPADFDTRAAAHVHVYLAQLMEILARVAEVLYAGVPDVATDIRAFVAEADDNFQTWLSALPESLRVDTKPPGRDFYLPSAMELHFIFHECIILLHRPLISPGGAAAHLTSPDQNTPSSLRRCIDSANEICRLLIAFRRQYGLRRPHHQTVHVAMTAALVHVFQLCSTTTDSNENREAQENLLTCIQALGEMGQTYKSASRALDVVTSVRQSWQDDVFAADRFKKPRLQK